MSSLFSDASADRAAARRCGGRRVTAQTKRGGRDWNVLAECVVGHMYLCCSGPSRRHAAPRDDASQVGAANRPHLGYQSVFVTVSAVVSETSTDVDDTAITTCHPAVETVAELSSVRLSTVTR